MTTTTTASASVDATALAARLRLAVTRLARRLRQEAEAGVTPSMLSALSSAERKGSLTMRDLCHAEQVQPPTMTRIVAALVEAGLVVREQDPADGRVAWVTVTTEGRRLLERSRRRKEAYLAKSLRSLEPEELRTLEAAAEILERLTDAPSGARS
ncbi:MAG TPA: MarR family transcriptional regulator [Actinomycetota bacterium]|nr:MarR family transcriptional regulator [Actinomycetota bacterium]